MIKLQVIVGSTRPGRLAEAVGTWAYNIAKERDGVEVELVDIADFDLPLLDEPTPPSLGQRDNDHTKKWSAKIAEADGYLFIAPEYNHGIPGALKNAIDYLYQEWNNRAAGFVSYGSSGGTRSVEHLRGVMGEVQIADVRAQVVMPLGSDFVNYSEFKPLDQREAELNVVLDQLIAWSKAMKGVRTEPATV